jgi:glycerol-3-phosphate dehydrogenase
VPDIHGKGVIVAPMLDGRLLAGPTAEEDIAKEDTRLITMAQFQAIGEIANRIVPGLRVERTYSVISGSRSICVWRYLKDPPPEPDLNTAPPGLAENGFL